MSEAVIGQARASRQSFARCDLASCRGEAAGEPADRLRRRLHRRPHPVALSPVAGRGTTNLALALVQALSFSRVFKRWKRKATLLSIAACLAAVALIAR